MKKVLSLLIVLAIIYTIVKNKILDLPENITPSRIITSEEQKTASVETKPDTPITGSFLEKTLSNVISNTLKTEEGRMFLENLLQPMNKPLSDGKHTIEVNRDLIQPMFKINSFGTGTVGSAICGHLVTIHYQILDMGNRIIDENDKTFILGTKPIIPGIDAIVPGMMVGQTRQAIVPAKYAYYDPQYRQENIDHEAPYRVNIALNAILPNNFIKSNEVKIFDNEVTYTTPFLCGNRVKFDARVTRLSKDQVIFDSIEHGKKVEMNIGDITYPMVLSYSLHGKVPVGTRTVIAKGKAFRALGSTLNRMIQQDEISKDEYLMLELTNFQMD
jgi:hypothetical protein